MGVFYREGREALLSGFDPATVPLRLLLVDLHQYASQIAFVDEGAPMIVTTQRAHGLLTGDTVQISGVHNMYSLNGVQTVTRLDALRLSVDDSVSEARYSSGGFVINLSNLKTSAGVPTWSRVARSEPLTNVSFDGTRLRADDVRLPYVNGTHVEAIVLYAGEDETTSVPLAVFADPVGLPFMPEGRAVHVRWPASGVLSVGQEPIEAPVLQIDKWVPTTAPAKREIFEYPQGRILLNGNDITALGVVSATIDPDGHGFLLVLRDPNDPLSEPHQWIDGQWKMHQLRGAIEIEENA